MKHLEEGDVNAAVEEMETSLKRLQRTYLSRVEASASRGAGPCARARAGAEGASRSQEGQGGRHLIGVLARASPGRGSLTARGALPTI